jgi:cold shock CspA family protein
MKGEVVKWFDTKGYGFVKSDDDETYFLHFSQMQNKSAPQIGDKVKFEAVETERGKQAQRCMIL